MLFLTCHGLCILNAHSISLGLLSSDPQFGRLFHAMAVDPSSSLRSIGDPAVRTLLAELKNKSGGQLQHCGTSVGGDDDDLAGMFRMVEEVPG